VKGKVATIITFFLLFSLWIISALAQVKEPKAQLLLIEHVVVNPSRANEFDASVKELLIQYSKYKFPYPACTFVTDDFHYYFVSSMKSFADIDDFFKANAETAKKIEPKQMQAIREHFAGTYEYSQFFVMRNRPDLSYVPEKPRLKSEEANYISIDFYYIQPGKEKEFEEVCKEYNTLDKSKNIPTEYSIAAMIIGGKLPLYIGCARGKNASDLFTQWEKELEILGDEGKVIWQKIWTLCRIFETKTGWFRPDLSYMPEKEKPTE